MTCDIIFYVAFGDHAAEHWEYVGAYISDEKQSGSKFGWFVLKDTLHAGRSLPYLSKRLLLVRKLSRIGIQLRIAEKSFRSASICSSCGLLNKGASLSSDTFRCSCGYTEDRSLNASYNLRDMVIYTTG